MKDKTIAYILWFFGCCGILGFHKFYLGKTAMGIAYIFTYGLFFIGACYDLFTLGRQVDEYNDQHRRRNTRIFYS